MKNLLLKYDTKHIRVFLYQDNFIKFSHYEDELLPLANLLFSTSSSLKISQNQIRKCHEHLNALKNPAYLFFYYADKKLTIQYHSSSHSEIAVSLDEKRSTYWYNLFQEQSHLFATSEQFQLPYSGKDDILLFFKEIGIHLPNRLTLLNVIYYGQFFFIPLEFLYDYFLVKHCLKADRKLSKIITKIGLMFDPDLNLAQEECLETLKLIEKRRFFLDNKNPDVLFVSAHGLSETASQLQNEILEEILKELNPDIVVFNSCLIAQNIAGVLYHFLHKGTYVIASPFHVLCHKTIFGPLLKFLSDTSEENISNSFFMLRIFYPNIYRFFRYYCPVKHP